MAIKICFANNKGGVAKTTSALCVAQELILRGKKVLFVDTDAQCNSTNFYQAKTADEYTMMDILCGDCDGSLCIQKTKLGDVIPSDKELCDAETAVKNDERRFDHIKRSLKTVEKDYEYIIFDTPPAIGVCLKNVLRCADYVIIPVEESGFAISGLMTFNEAIELAKEHNEKLEVLGILTVKAKERTKKSARLGELTDEIADKLGTSRFNTKIRETVACSEAITEYYVPIQEYAPNSTTKADYEAFTTELLERLGK